MYHYWHIMMNMVDSVVNTTIAMVVVVIVTSTSHRYCSAQEQIKYGSGQCILPLGMEGGEIPDNAISASSSYETKSVGPQNARIRQEKNGGAWCPKAQISNDIREYLEIDLTKDHVITWTETQGRFGNGQGQEYAEAFFLEYWRNSSWHQYKTIQGERILRGNSNTYLVERQKLELPFIASRVRFVPYSQHPRTVCMRVELYGCIWEQKIVEYKAPKAAAYGPGGINTEDISYDGRDDIDANFLTDGLGQLVDGIIGENLKISSSMAHWVGWSDWNPVPIIFKFAEIREFNTCTIYSANLPADGIEVFKQVRVTFSWDGENYDSTSPIEMLVNAKPPYSPAAIPIVIPLRSMCGRYVRLELEPRSKWLLISEITFETLAGPGSSGNTSNHLKRLVTEHSDHDPQNDTMAMININQHLNSDVKVNDTDTGTNSIMTPDAFPVVPRWSQTYIGLVSGALTVLALLLTGTVFLMKLRGRNKVALLQKHTALLCGSNTSGITMNVKDSKDVKLPTPIVVNGSQSRLTSSLKSSGNQRPSSRTSNLTPIVIGEKITTEQRASSCENEQAHCNIYTESTYKLSFPDGRTFTKCKTDYADVSEFISESVALTNVESNDRLTQLQTPYAQRSSKYSRHDYTTSKCHKIYEGYYAATDILTIKRREQHTGTSLFTSLLIEHRNNVESFDLQHISRHRLRILDKIGEGSFGFVHLCEAKGIQSPDMGTTRNRQPVMVRSLWRGVTDSLKKDFMRDMSILAQIRDPNITRIVALVEEEPFGAVFEYGELGELPNFIRNNQKSNNDSPFSYSQLIKFIIHIASGMKYLESMNISHCDLAARNCVVSKNLSIKVSDHAMYCSKYDNEYYVNECYIKIPLRWMAWEAVLLGKRSCSADVWSFATTVWEILTYCEEIPFSNMTSQQVLQNCGNWYHSVSPQNKAHILSQPSICSRDLYQLMTECWSKHSEDRPTFQNIYFFLKQLTLIE